MAGRRGKGLERVKDSIGTEIDRDARGRNLERLEKEKVRCRERVSERKKLIERKGGVE